MSSMMWQDYDNQNQQMVDKFIKLGVISLKDVENAFRCVNRAAFVSKSLLGDAFNDAPIRGSSHIHMSAPLMYAAILEDLELEPGMTFLNIGSGTGYFSTLAGFMIKPHGVNHGIEIHETLVEFARERVNDFFRHRVLVAKEICPPTFITGNCFLLDPSQMKYDRLYCGGSCSPSNITFFLEFLKVGGFLIAPLGNKLIKLERVSYKEGVKTVLSDVCFAPLTRLDSKDLAKKRDGLLPLLQFPPCSKREKPKKTIFIDANFPVCKSVARKKLARLRAVQDALDCLQKNSSVPKPFCYSPNLDQINAYNHYRKICDSKLNGQLFKASRPLNQSKRSLNNTLTSFVPVQVNQNRQLTTFQASDNQPVVVLQNSATTNSDNYVKSDLIPSGEKDPSNHFCNDSLDIWNHLYSDKLWENVVDYYYSVCSTSNDRKDRCFHHKGIINTNSMRVQRKSFKNPLSCFPLPPKENGTSELQINAKEDKFIIDIKKTLENVLLKVCNSQDITHKCISGANKEDSKQLSDIDNNKIEKYFNIEIDSEISSNLSRVLHCDWSHKHDVELISFLVENKKESESLMLKENLPKVFRSDIFERSSFLKYPLLSNVNATLLTYRSISLIRIVRIIDSVLDILVGPSLKHDQFHNPFQEKYPLVSFTEDSFKLSGKSCYKSQLSQTFELTEKNVYKDANTAEEKELLKEVTSMISCEIENVEQQQIILGRKLELIDSIDEQYKEQIKLLNQQVELIEEQQHLLADVSLEDSLQDSTSQNLIADKKQQRQSLLDKRDKISANRVFQNFERKELLSMLEQLLSLKTKLHREMSLLKLKGMGYLHAQDCGLSNFSQFVHKAEELISKLRSSSSKFTEFVENKKVFHFNSESTNDNTSTKFRYQPNTILPRCRFLLPLSKKRHTFIKEMLRSSERSAPQQIPVISVDRNIPLSQRKTEGDYCTVFMQVYHGILHKELNYRWNKKSFEQWWEVKFTGEGIIDQGGGFRDSLAEISEELCPPDPEVHSPLPFFIKTPNQKSGCGNHLDCFTLNPSCDDFPLFYWIGQLMGACFRTDETLPLPLAPYIWKILVGEQVTWEKDYVTVDEAAVRNMEWLEDFDEDAYAGLQTEETFTTHLSNQVEVELCPNGSNKVVKWNERKEFSMLVRKARMLENVNQLKALRSGLTSVVPEGVLSCLTWQNLERGVCGDPCISLADLKANCRFGDDLKATSQSIMCMWSALQSFTDLERSRFIRFITGRKRLPSPFIVSRSSMSIDNLPSASTCGSNLFLPDYSNAAICTEKLRYAIYNCVAIDTDTSPW